MLVGGPYERFVFMGAAAAVLESEAAARKRARPAGGTGTHALAQAAVSLRQFLGANGGAGGLLQLTRHSGTRYWQPPPQLAKPARAAVGDSKHRL